MKAQLFLVIAFVQAIFFVLLVGLIVVNRVRRRLAGKSQETSSPAVALAFTRWLLGETTVDVVIETLRAAPPGVALEETLAALSRRVPPASRHEVVDRLRREPWVRAMLARARKRAWWDRLAAARMLAAAGTELDRELLRRLLADVHPAVQTAATGAIERIADRTIVEQVLDQLVTRPLVVRQIQMSALLRARALTTPALLERLVATSPPRSLEVWIALAEQSTDPACIRATAELAAHEDAQVRLAVARALRHFYDVRVHETLAALLRDPDWRVRAAACRTAGSLADAAFVGPLRQGLGDTAWWVRFRAALALAQLGEPGRKVLREARNGDDRFARDMATMVSGLSDGGILELAES